MRIFLAGLAHETNTFSPLPTTLRSFAEGVLHRLAGSGSSLDKARQFPGYVDCLQVAGERGDEVVTGLCAWAQPGGPVSRRDFELLRDELLHELADAGRVDFVFLVLHGAMVAEGYTDCEGDLLARVRQQVGPHVPVGALLDLHGNVTPAMVGSGAVLVACKEYPHTDYLPRTRELYSVLAAMAQEGLRVSTVFRRVPMLGLFGTTEPPMSQFVRRLKSCENVDGVLSVSAMHGFPWSDTPHTTAAILVACKGDDPPTLGRATQLADELATELFALRSNAAAPRLPLEAALDAALAASRPGAGPVVMADGSDNPGGGAAADSTFVLRALMSRHAQGVALGMIWDPQAARIAADAGPGARLPLRIGGKVGPLSGDPIDVQATVLAVRDDASQRGLDGKVRDPLGKTVALRVGGIDIVVNSIRQQVFSPDCFTELGIDPASKALIVVKSTQHFRAAFDAIAAVTIYCDAPGSLNGNLKALGYRHLRRPIWPLDLITALDAHPESPA
jgi:microcystin degradation protein MlrC